MPACAAPTAGGLSKSSEPVCRARFGQCRPAGNCREVNVQQGLPELPVVPGSSQARGDVIHGQPIAMPPVIMCRSLACWQAMLPADARTTDYHAGELNRKRSVGD